MDSTREYESAAAHQHSKRRREEDTHQQQPDKFIVTGGKYLRFALDIEKEVVPYVAKFVQNLLREEMEALLTSRQTMNETGAHVVKSFELVFKNDLPATVFTHSNIKAKDGSPIQIALYDTRSQLIVTDDPLLSSIKVKICVLNGEFGGDENENWSTTEFKANISRERENRSKLLKGDTVITLNNGVGYIGKIMFTDNSKCTWSRHFRLGAIVSSTSHQATIKEAISNPFIVKDSRGECKSSIICS
ncbi:Calmodulin-binding protein D [Arachis hypogaea]|nr:Calmodulin-binding protein D [Arachis hypogaea]